MKTLAKLNGKELFPIGQPVVVEAIIDGSCGWEFDAPLHIMRPLHKYREVGSICIESVEAAIENLIIDISCGLEIGDQHDWPYTNAPSGGMAYLEGLLKRLRRGKGRRGVMYYKAEVTVRDWDKVEYDFKRIDC